MPEVDPLVDAGPAPTAAHEVFAKPEVPHQFGPRDRARRSEQVAGPKAGLAVQDRFLHHRQATEPRQLARNSDRLIARKPHASAQGPNEHSAKGESPSRDVTLAPGGQQPARGDEWDQAKMHRLGLHR